MFGCTFIKFDPTIHVLHYKNGRLRQEGAGLAFFYFAPTSTIVAVPRKTLDVPFAFNDVTADFQTVTIQGQLSYRVSDPKRLAALLNFSVDANGHYTSDDPSKLHERLMHAAQSVIRALIQGQQLATVLTSAEKLATAALGNFKSSELLMLHGLELLNLSIVSLKPTPETAKAFEADAREALLRKADEAIYARRNAAVEQERTIKESELDTEKSMEEKKRQIREAQMDAEIAVERKRRAVRETQIEADIAIEEKRAPLMDQRTQNDRKDTESRAYTLERMVAPLTNMDWRMLAALQGGGMDSKMLIADAFDRLATNAQHIGQLNITPDLLKSLLATADQ